jgi:WD40 repeat protein
VAPLPETPYVGLTPFSEGDARFFFGRERERRLLAASILSSRLTLLYGASGVGKSSLLRAGLVADFAARAHSAVAAGRLPESVLVVCSGWRDDPLRALAEAIEAAVRDQLGEHAPEPPPFTPRLENLLAGWLARLDERAAVLAPDADEPPRSELLLVLDQFEEYFLYHPDEDGDGTLAVELPRAVMREDLRASFLVSIREDSYTQLDRFEGRIRNLFASNFRLEHLDEPAARRAIEGPVERYNELLPEDDGRYAVEPALVDAVLEQVRAGTIALGQAGGGTVETDGAGDLRVATPFLQLVMTRLWEEERRSDSQTLRAATLVQLGGAERLVRSHLDDALAELGERERDLTAAVFHQLVTPSGTKIVHTIPDLADYADASEPELTPVLEALAAARILRPVDPAPGDTSPRFEIFHDVLGPAILDWRAAHERERAARAESARLRRVRKRFAAGAVGMLLLVLVFAGLAVWAVGQQRTAEENEAEAAAAADRAGSAAVAGRALEGVFGPATSALAGAEAHRLSPSFDARSATLSSLHVNAALPQVLDGHLYAVGAVAFSPDGLVASGGGDWIVRLWNAQGRAVGDPYVAEGEIASVAFSPDGTMLAAAIGDELDEIHLFAVEARSWRFLRSFATRHGDVHAVAFVAGDLVTSGGEDGHVRLWDVGDGADPREIEDEPVGAPVRGLAYESTSRLLAVAAGGPLLWTLTGGGRLEPGPALPDAGRVGTRTVALSADGRSLAAAAGATISVWQTSAAAPPKELVASGPVLSLAFADDATLVSGGEDDNVTVWDVARGEAYGPPRAHEGDVFDVAVGPNRLIASAGDDSYVKLWPLDGRGALATTVGGLPTDSVWDLAVGSGAQVAVANEWDGTTLWELHRPSDSTSKPRRLATIGADGGSYAVAYHGTVLAASDGGRFVLWETETGPDCPTAPRRPCRLGSVAARDSHDEDIAALAFSPAGELLAAIDDAGQVSLWDTSAPKNLRRLSVQPAPGEKTLGWTVAFSPGSRILAAGYDPGQVRLWNVQDPGAPDQLRDLKVQQGEYVRSLAFSPNGGLLAVAGGARRVELFDVRQPRSIRQTEPSLGHWDQLYQVAFSPDGRVVAGGDAYGQIRLWDLESRRALGSTSWLPGRDGTTVSIDGLAFTEDGTLVSAGDGNPVVAWDAALWSDETKTLRTSACSLARRNLTAEEWAFFFQDTSLEDSRRRTCPGYPLPRENRPR